LTATLTNMGLVTTFAGKRKYRMKKPAIKKAPTWRGFLDSGPVLIRL